MKLLRLGLTLLAALPGVLQAQARVHVSAPSVRLTLGPLSIRAGLERGRVAVTAAPVRARPTTTVPRETAGGSARAAGVLGTGRRYVGTRYVYGGEDPSGFDCSGFVQYVFARHGVALPRTSREQAGAGTRLPPGTVGLRPGDLMLFASTGTGVDHVAIYAGNGRILHSSRSGGGVGYDELESARGRWFLARHVASRRVL